MRELYKLGTLRIKKNQDGNDRQKLGKFDPYVFDLMRKIYERIDEKECCHSDVGIQHQLYCLHSKNCLDTQCQ